MPFFGGKIILSKINYSNPDLQIKSVESALNYLLEDSRISQSNINSNSYIRTGLNSQPGDNPTDWILTVGTAYLLNEGDRESKPIEFKVESDLNMTFPPPLLSNSQVWTYIDLNSNLVYTTEPPKSWQLGDRIYLNSLKSEDGSTISQVIPIVLEGDSYTKILLDAGGTKNINLSLTPGSGLSLASSGGTVLIAGQNFFNDQGNPHRLQIPATSQIIWDEFDPENRLLATGVTELNFGRYWDGLSVATFTGNDATVKFFYVDREQNYSCIIGSNRYNSLNVAVERWQSFESIPKFFDRVLIGILLGREDAANTDSDRVIILEGSYD